jgi:hypothetical protein
VCHPKTRSLRRRFLPSVQHLDVAERHRFATVTSHISSILATTEQNNGFDQSLRGFVHEA